MIKNVKLTSGKTTLIVLLIILSIVGITISSADSVPVLPNTFSGTVKFADSGGQFDAPQGTLIEALIDNVTKGSTTVSIPGSYFLNVDGTIDDDNKDITFRVNNITTEQKSVFISMAPPRTLNLIVNTTSPAAGEGYVCAGLCHIYTKNLDRNIDFYPDSTTSFDRYETFIGFLNQIRDTPMNVTDPRIDFYYNPGELYGNDYDYFRNVQPSIKEDGYAVFRFNDLSLSNGNGTTGVDEGERFNASGFSVRRQLENNGTITKDGYYNVTVSAVLYENVSEFISLSTHLWNSSEFNSWVVRWSTGEMPDGNNTDSNHATVNFNTRGDTLPKEYNLTVTFYVDKIIPANITLKPWVDASTRNKLQSTQKTRVSSVSINGTMFNMNSTFTSSNHNLTWLAEEAHKKRIGLEGGITEISSPFAVFKLNKDFFVKTYNDSLTSDVYERSPWYDLGIDNENDTSDTVLGDLRFSARADNITKIDWEQYATWNKTSAAWAFPSSFAIKENDWFITSLKTNHSESRFVGVNISRWMNQTLFNTDGVQLAKFNVTFINSDFEWVWGHIDASSLYGANVSIVPGTFTYNAPIRNIREESDAVDFEFEKERVQTGITYNFSVLIEIRPTGERKPPILYKPEFAIGEGTYYNSTAGAAGTSVEMPSWMLPDNVNYASAAVNTTNSWLLVRNDHITARLQRDDLRPEIINFKVAPDTSVGKSNPATASASVQDENLRSVEFGFVDSSDLLSTNMTMLGFYVNESGANGVHTSLPWYADATRITNGTIQDIVTPIYHADWKDHILVSGWFKKNATASQEKALLWFNRTTGNYSHITAEAASSIPVIENGISVFRVTAFKFVNGLENPPVFVDGATFTLYGDVENNPYLVSIPVPSGSYKATIHAEDMFGNNEGAMEDVGVVQTTSIQSITDLHNITYAPNYINWTWTDPTNPVFSKVMVYLDGNFQTNVSKGVQYYNATALAPATTYMISTRTADTAGNINLTWVNHTARTLDVLSYYRRLTGNQSVVDTIDLLNAADDWSNDRKPPGFVSPITTVQLLTLADEWSRG